MTQPPKYAQKYAVENNCLYESYPGKNGIVKRKLCNLAPEIVWEITVDDGAVTTTYVRLRGVHESGRALPEIEIPAADLASFNWMAERWGMDCILEVGKTVKDCVRHDIQTTAAHAEKKTVFAVTGWKKIGEEWHYLMPGDDNYTVDLYGKLQGYGMERSRHPLDIQTAASLLWQPLAPEEIQLALLSFTFLSLLNHFLKEAGCEPKFVLLLSGKTGSQKSTLAALMLSFFGKFTASELPLSFRDTANSILLNTFSLKDVLTVIDDLHPSSRMEEPKMNGTAQAIMRAYGDRTGKGRLRSDSTLMESRPPQGNSLRIEAEEAKVVQMIYDMYGKQGMGYNAIAYALNDMHIPARKGEWSQTSIVDTLTNEVYLGKIRWRREPVKRVVRDGFLAKTRILNDDYELYDGMHEPIITEEQWEMAKAVKKKKGHHSTRTTKELKNPFADILFCEKCGAIMKRYLPHPRESPIAWYRCQTRGCDCKMVKCEVVENSIRNAMEDWLENDMLQIESDRQPKADPIATALEAVRGQLAQLQSQQENICEYLEKGVYTIDMFTRRNATLAKEIKQLQSAESDLLRQQGEGKQKKQATSQIIPTTQHILDNYDTLTIAEKNRLWKLVMRRATVYRSPDNELTVNIYPNLPK